MELDFLYYMKILAICTFSFVAYRLLILEKSEKTRDHYTRPAWNFFLKKLYAEYIIKKQKKRQVKILRDLRSYENEAPKILPNEESSDSQQLYGNDHEGNSVLIKFTRRQHRIAEVWLILNIKNGKTYVTYTLPDHPQTKIKNATPKIFEGSGLKIECLAPYSRWRITYTGMLRKGAADSATNDESNLHFVRLNLIWTAASEPSFWPFEWSTKLMATALASEKWRDAKWKNLLNLKDSGGYGQFGTCKGQIKIFENSYDAYKSGLLPKADVIEVNLPGIRQRRWGPHKTEHLHRTAIILGSFKDGTVLEVGAFSSKVGVTHSQFGSIRLPHGEVAPIDWTDLNLASVGENRDQLPQATILQINAGGHDFVAVVSFKNNRKVPLHGGSANDKWNAFIIPVDIVLNANKGYGVAVLWYPRTDVEFEFEEFASEIKKIHHNSEKLLNNKKILSFTESEAQNAAVAGGKGSSLAILHTIQDTKGEHFIDSRGRNFQVLNALVDQFSPNNRQFRNVFNYEPPKVGRQRSGSLTKSIFPDPNDTDTPDFSVPQGFIITVSAYEDHLKAFPEIRKAIQNVEEVAYERTEGDVQDACLRAQDTFKSTQISDELKNAISKKLTQIKYEGNVRFAVRSSGVTEDAKELSSAGQNQTFLGLGSNEEIYEAVIKCWASLYSYQSVLYRKQNILPVRTAMGVVVQKMVPAESAGVLFSRHFLNGDPSVIVITANYGLGESVVAAKSEPDTFLIKRDYKGDEVKILAKILGEKKLLVEMSDKTSTREVDIDDEKRKNFCLTDDVILKLARISIVMEKFFEGPRDIEFAVTKDKNVYLLQSRPITALNNFTDYEIIHEADSAIMATDELLCKCNVGDALNGSTTAISRSFMVKCFDKRISENIMHKKASKLYDQCIVVSQNHIFLNGYIVFLANMASATPALIDQITQMSVTGRNVYEELPELLDIAKHRNKFRSNRGINKMKTFFKYIFGARKASKEIEPLIKKIQLNIDKNLKKYKTSVDIYDFIERERKNIDEVMSLHLYFTGQNSIVQSFLFLAMLYGLEKIKTEHQRDINMVLGSIGTIESANVPELMREISKTIEASGRHKEFLKVETYELIEWMKANCPQAHELFVNFIERHGHRSYRELDLSTKPWAMEPQKLVEMIKVNLSYPSPVKKEKFDVKEMLEKIQIPLNKFQKFLLSKMIPWSHSTVRKREKTKSILVQAVNELRRAIMRLAEIMVNEGLLPEKDLIFHLSWSEIKTVIRARDSRLINNAVRRRRVHSILDELKFDEFNFGIPRPLSEREPRQNVFEEENILARGMAVCNGKIEGRACVVKSFAEVDKIQGGDILITYSTDISWSPYFNIISGICTEIGGLISHGAVVARECNLPCIVGATRATDRIKHGETIILNADDGIIYKAN